MRKDQESLSVQLRPSQLETAFYWLCRCRIKTNGILIKIGMGQMLVGNLTSRKDFSKCKKN